MPDGEPVWVAGVDGCRAGWLAIFRDVNKVAEPTLRLFERFADILRSPTQPAKIAVDMPIGLPDHMGSTGRGAEKAVRAHLGMRQSTVFAIPSRKAVYCEDYWEACEVAMATSSPPRKVSKQAFYLFPKIRELDEVMLPALEETIFEVHPEMAFWRLNGQAPIPLPKKVKGQPNGAGLDMRRDLLTQFDYSKRFLDQKPPKGAGRDDVLDACVNAVIAERLFHGEAEPFPQDFRRDGRGLRMAIWA
ncbi:DUF429 domain-containing protein [Pseudovibrio sp. SPO723]|uniref:DUF429 domain-containing protein n=1 Tax=Nesiotobacter zosterae TaxID=392721 RepID=UPI0029C4B0A9|nr:DUF429 domain-containing protein [Pseudovibrio sp. SPO723]MDX5594907.1 DUF429 domain-containing protein [Pseudovibrio sp. SPO723]